MVLSKYFLLGYVNKQSFALIFLDFNLFTFYFLAKRWKKNVLTKTKDSHKENPQEFPFFH